MIKQLILVGLGGATGSIFRFLISFFTSKFHLVYSFPLATFTVNITGCILIGLLIGLSDKYTWLDKDMKLLLITGFCGGYTTFSAFSLENVQLMENQHYLTFAFYVAGSILFGIAAVFLGSYLSKL
jgi:CrcB protein